GGPLGAGQDLPGLRRGAQSGGQVQGRSPVATGERNRFARIEADAGGDGEGWVGGRGRGEPALQLDGRQDGCSCRIEYGERLVPAELDDGPPPCVDRGPRALGESRRPPGRGPGSMLLQGPPLP